MTAKAQTTIPHAVRAALDLHAGDEVGYLIEERAVVLLKVATPSEDDPFAVFTEWGGEADTRNYREL